MSPPREELRAEQSGLEASRLVFIDETAVTTKMTRLYGRAPLGERLVAKVPHDTTTYCPPTRD